MAHYTLSVTTAKIYDLKINCLALIIHHTVTISVWGIEWNVITDASILERVRKVCTIAFFLLIAMRLTLDSLTC